MGNIKTLNDNLHDQLARLNSDISGDELKMEIERAKAMSQLGTVIVNNSKIALIAMKMSQGGNIDEKEADKLLGY